MLTKIIVLKIMIYSKIWIQIHTGSNTRFKTLQKEALGCFQESDTGKAGEGYHRPLHPEINQCVFNE